MLVQITFLKLPLSNIGYYCQVLGVELGGYDYK